MTPITLDPSTRFYRLLFRVWSFVTFPNEYRNTYAEYIARNGTDSHRLIRFKAETADTCAIVGLFVRWLMMVVGTTLGVFFVMFLLTWAAVVPLFSEEVRCSRWAADACKDLGLGQLFGVIFFTGCALFVLGLFVAISWEARAPSSYTVFKEAIVASLIRVARVFVQPIAWLWNKTTKPHPSRVTTLEDGTVVVAPSAAGQIWQAWSERVCRPIEHK